MNNYSYKQIAELGIAVCVSCGSANVNENHKEKNSLPSDWCFICNYDEGTDICMPDDINFYNEAKKTLNKLKANKL